MKRSIFFDFDIFIHLLCGSSRVVLFIIISLRDFIIHPIWNSLKFALAGVGGAEEIGIESIRTSEDIGAIFTFFIVAVLVGGAEAFLFFASFLAALVRFTSDAEGRVICFTGEVASGAAAEELDGSISSGSTDAVALAVSSGTTSSVALSCT